jgi:hypothetical protein
LINHLYVFYVFLAFLYTHCNGVGGLAGVFERILGNEGREVLIRFVDLYLGRGFKGKGIREFSKFVIYIHPHLLAGPENLQDNDENC